MQSTFSGFGFINSENVFKVQKLAWASQPTKAALFGTRGWGWQCWTEGDTGCRHCWASTSLGGGLPCSHLPALFPTLEGWAGLWGATRVVSGRTALLPQVRCWLLSLRPPISRRPCTQMFSSAFCVEDTGLGVCPRSSSLEPGGSTALPCFILAGSGSHPCLPLLRLEGGANLSKAKPREKILTLPHWQKDFCLGSTF